ncbi:MAG: hypothetical protein FJZ00_00255 [Candidatus Sericytochromatia bacterium]|uniref:BIG2 domain-containing protein n=1 Tax=Candidatus Tanganyikabacteria bacterium TaxID=2961651 RepID=A0A937X055_9BACT|nr:hypothetical protein [Candidatus Tanganyikabacteria bacterium]
MRLGLRSGFGLMAITCAAIAACEVDTGQLPGTGPRPVAVKSEAPAANASPVTGLTAAPSASATPRDNVAGGIEKDDTAPTPPPAVTVTPTPGTPTPTPTGIPKLAPTPEPVATRTPSPVVESVVIAPNYLELYQPAPDGSFLAAFPATASLVATVRFQGGATASAVTWSVSDGNAATASAGIVRILSGTTADRVTVYAVADADNATRGSATIDIKRKSQVGLEIK